MCWTIRIGTLRFPGIRGSILDRAWGPPVEMPIPMMADLWPDSLPLRRTTPEKSGFSEKPDFFDFFVVDRTVLPFNISRTSLRREYD